VRLRRAEQRGECRELARRQSLPANRQHLPGVERALDLGERCSGKRLRQVDVEIDAKSRRERRVLEHLKLKRRSPPDLFVVTALQFYFRKSGRINCGRNNGISGHTIRAAKTTSIGTNMISVSFSA
jgi:hypothetical protein